jgi:hypothetical protein
MKKRILTLVSVAAFSVLSLSGGENQNPPSAPPPMNPGYETAKLKVLKVYYAKDGDAIFRAYVVKWKEQEVVVSDTLARTHYRVGDVATVLVMKQPFRNGEGKEGLLAFQVLPEGDKNMPNPQGGANGRQPSGSETNRTSAAVSGRPI